MASKTAVMEPLRGALTVRDAALYLSMGKTSVYAMLRSGELKGVSRGRKTVISIAELDRFLAGTALSDRA